MLNDLAKNIILWIVIAIVLLTVFQSFGTGQRQSDTRICQTPELGGPTQARSTGAQALCPLCSPRWPL